MNPRPTARAEFEAVRDAYNVLRDDKRRMEYDAKHDIEVTLEKRAEADEKHWMERVKFRSQMRPDGKGRVWSEKLSRDVLRSSALRSVKR